MKNAFGFTSNKDLNELDDEKNLQEEIKLD
jgi:hypothetical protein